MYSKTKWINILTTILALLSMGEMMFTLFLLFTFGDILYHTTTHICTACGFITSLISLPTAFKIKWYQSESKVKQHHYYLNNYHRILLYTCLIAQSIAILIVFIRICQVNTTYYALLFSIKQYRESASDKVFVDMVQLLLQCCGVESYEDWFHFDLTNNFYNLEKANFYQDRIMVLSDFDVRSDNVPYSCCSLNVAEPCEHMLMNDFGSSTINRTGCLESLRCFVMCLIISQFVVYILLTIPMIFLLRLMKFDEEEDPLLNSLDAEYGGSCRDSIKSWSQFTNSVQLAELEPSSQKEKKIRLYKKPVHY